MRSLLMGCRASYFNLETKILGKTHKRASRLPRGLARCLLSWRLQDQGWHLLPPGSGTLRLRAGMDGMTHRARLSGQLLTLRWPVPSLSCLADSAFLLSVHVPHSSLPPPVGLPEKPGQGQDSCELWAVESRLPHMYPGGADSECWELFLPPSLPSYLQRSHQLPSHCGRRQGPGGGVEGRVCVRAGV